jgi:hypothetical protein
MTLCDLDDASSRSRQRMITFLSETYRTSDQESRVCERLDLSSARALSSLPTLQPQQRYGMTSIRAANACHVASGNAIIYVPPSDPKIQLCNSWRVVSTQICMIPLRVAHRRNLGCARENSRLTVEPNTSLAARPDLTRRKACYTGSGCTDCQSLTNVEMVNRWWRMRRGGVAQASLLQDRAPSLVEALRSSCAPSHSNHAFIIQIFPRVANSLAGSGCVYECRLTGLGHWRRRKIHS